jgi:hypothetical protein
LRVSFPWPAVVWSGESFSFADNVDESYES